MLRIQWTNSQRKYQIAAHIPRLEKLLAAAWESLPAAQSASLEGVDLELALGFVSCAAMRRINQEQRGISRKTDVLSFPMHQFHEGRISETLTGADLYPYEDGSYSLFLGDILICPEVAAQQAEAYGHSLERELAFLALHGFLHLCGYDHMDEAEEGRMREKQRSILEAQDIRRDGPGPELKE